MDVILKADVKGLGKKGEKVKASDGYARNFLFPKGLAVEANAQSLTELRNREQSNQHKIDVEVAAANDSKAKLQGKVIKITAKAGNNGKLFGSVTSKEVAAEIAKQYAVKVDKRKISMDDIKTFGSYKIEVKLYTNIVAEMTVMVGE
ncbi:MAG: 50S ribosomal protein L9 [Clostridia bacterium]|nr:50S ribosomal protein L9 [Clostridia bacterium]MBQ4644471.1 50S ribosomal protein L9 [Clostridia bacterium]MBR2953170.1 50S ribosomal protein L9 [Clostridia bacterium]